LKELSNKKAETFGFRFFVYTISKSLNAAELFYGIFVRGKYYATVKKRLGDRVFEGIIRNHLTNMPLCVIIQSLVEKSANYFKEKWQ
jgi:hypothetical protein